MFKKLGKISLSILLAATFAVTGLGMNQLYSIKADDIAAANESLILTPEIKTESGLIYKVDGGSAIITGYVGKESSVEIPAKIGETEVKAIAADAFRGNLVVKKIVIAEGVMEIGSHAFDDCSYLEEIVIPNGITAIKEGCFFSCVNLKSLSLPDSLTTIGQAAFYQCESLESITFPANLKTIGKQAFHLCTKLKEVKLPGKVATIGREAFSGCTKITTIVIPESVKTIGQEAFANNEVLRNLTLPKGAVNIGKEAFRGCYKLKSVTVNTKTLKEGTFAYCSQLSNVTLGKSVQTIEKEVFSNTMMKKLTIPKSVKKIVPGAFISSGISKITVASGNKNYTVVNGVLFTADKKTLLYFPLKTASEEYKIPAGTREIADYAISGYDNEKLKTLVFPDSLVKIGKEGVNAYGITAFKFGKGLKEIGDGAFKDNYDIKTIVLPDSVEVLGDNCFSECGQLKRIVLSKNLKKMGKLVFNRCNSLKSITIPAGVTSIDSQTFTSSDLKTIKVDSGNKKYCSVDGVLYSKDMKTLIAYPSKKTASSYTVNSKTTKIGSYAFVGNDSLNNLVLPKGLKSIGEYSIGRINTVLPAELSSIADCAIGYEYDVMTHVSTKKTCVIKVEKTYSNEISQAIKDYASKKDYALAYDDIKMTATGLIDAVNEGEFPTLKLNAGDTSKMSLENLAGTKVYYFSQDKNVANVDVNGTITAVGSGKTYIIAAAGSTYFVIDLTVEGAAKTNGANGTIDELNKNYKLVNETTLSAWESAYNNYNKDVSRDEKTNENLHVYTSGKYLPIVAAQQKEDYYYYDKALEGGSDLTFYKLIGDDLNLELNRFKLQENTILFSGTPTAKDFTKNIDTIENLVGSIGKEVTYPTVISTSLSDAIANSFMTQPDGVVLEIYAPKDNNYGAYIKEFSNFPYELELLLGSGKTYRIVDAGVKVSKPHLFDSIGVEENYSVHKYISLVVVK